MINIVIPMAGEGSRFRTAGYDVPKPLIPVCGTPMIQLVIENLRPLQDHRFIFLTRSQHQNRYGLDDLLKQWSPDAEIVSVEQPTQGAACTVLLARDFIDTDQPLMLANCDQYIDYSIDEYLQRLNDDQADGLLMTMTADDPKWSFVGRDSYGRVNRVVEKSVISNEATVGIYNFRYGRDFVAAADSMISKDLRVNGEFYVAPAYNEMIADAKKLTTCNVGSEGHGMYGLGIPEDLRAFEALPLASAVSVR